MSRPGPLASAYKVQAGGGKGAKMHHHQKESAIGIVGCGKTYYTSASQVEDFSSTQEISA